MHSVRSIDDLLGRCTPAACIQFLLLTILFPPRQDFVYHPQPKPAISFPARRVL